MGLLAASCAETTTPEENREAAIQTTVIRWIADKHPPAAPENPDEVPVVFIESLSTDGIPIEVQVEIIDRLVDEMTIRFTDSRAEAVDDADAALAVRDGSILVGLGPIPDGSDPAVRAEIYRSLDDISGYIVEIESNGGRWVVEGEPEETPAEGLIVAED